ncbi:class I SAM-dependent methyltransferase [bacterium]|nr:MAG: class I SAM-dependent methyltransferase [bacterium]
MSDDVPSPIDLRSMPDAQEWESTAMQKRPWRTEFFDAFAQEVKSATGLHSAHILELGSGPGFLAKHLLDRIPNITRYVALDFSSAMHQLAIQRLGEQVSRVEFVERSFLQPAWHSDLGAFDFVVTHQAVHELRHKRHATFLHAKVAQLLKPSGKYLVCDHFAGMNGMKNTDLYMSANEQAQSLKQGGFSSVLCLLKEGGLVLHSASIQ